MMFKKKTKKKKKKLLDSDDSEASSAAENDEFVAVKLSEIRKEVQCPICLGIIRKTRTVMECLHRFCRECIDKAMRLGNNECPACRTHCASRRSLRDDPNYDSLIAALYPDIEKYEEEELAFHEEEKARNKQIQDSIAQTLRRQTEALGKKRAAKATAAAYMRRSQRNLRGRRSHRAAEHLESDDEENANGHDGGNSSADEKSTEMRPKRQKRCSGTRSSQPSENDVDVDCDENDVDVKRESLGASAGIVGSTYIFTWGKGGMRSQNRHGNLCGGPRSSRLSKLIDCLRCSDQNIEGMDVSLMLLSLHEDSIPSLQRPYLCCKPTLSVKHLCQYVAMQTSMQPQEIEMLLVKDIEMNTLGESQHLAIDPIKNELCLVEEHQSLAVIQSMSSFNMVLAYRRKS
ncbi:hypothetical protein Leryth_025719 [Lithospermum erythrorhizon]|nr:hypothetical protein Leryth_025719 [Lithospermum erythrorhizon]